MIEAIRRYFQNNFFDKELSFRYRLSSIFFIESFILSLLSFVANSIFGETLLGMIVQGLELTLCLVIFFIPLPVKQKVMGPFLLALIFGYIPFMFFQFGGYDGSVLFFAILALFFLAFLYDGKKQVLLVVVDVAIYLVAIVLQMTVPGAVIPMADAETRVFDILAGLTFTMLGLLILARYVGKAYESERLRNSYLLSEVESQRNELEELSVRDGLTGVFNRRYLTEVSEQILIRANNERRSACAIMFDIDLFKEVNDTYGHMVGDKVLVKIVEAAKLQLRKHDMIARYGGEEFLIILYPETLENALQIAERIRAAVEALEFKEGITVTVSLGVAETRGGDDAGAILRRADKCLYKAKHEGRNRVECEQEY